LVVFISVFGLFEVGKIIYNGIIMNDKKLMLRFSIASKHRL